ncbi:MAG TPA: ABC transporter substrate-binding protein [Patescibacteria group bacterium]|nr:ABC transporter substrate-binding protein [Patescibacteria group bacterium]
MSLTRFFVAAILTVALAATAGCGRREEPPTLRLALETEPTTLDPAYAVDYSSGLITSLIHANLVRYDPDGRIIPDLARSWDISADGTLYTFHLAGSRFSNGKALSAADVVFTFWRLIDPEIRSPRWWVLEPVAGAAAVRRGGEWGGLGIEAADDSTVCIRLERPTAHFLSLVSMPAAGIVTAGEISARGEDYGRMPCGSGPWMLSAWGDGDQLLLVRNPYFEGAAPVLDGISLRIIPEPMTRIAEFEVGNLDILEVPRAELDRWRSAGVTLMHEEELRVVYIGLNNERPLFSDIRVRRALNRAIDVETIIARVLFGAGRRARGVIPPGLRRTRVPDERYPYDPEGARKLLAEAGYPDGFEMELWQRENPEGGRVLESIQGYLAAVGIRAAIVTREWSAFKKAVEHGAADAFYLDWFADYPDPENFLAPLFHSANRGGGGNRTGYSDAAVDSLITAAGLCRDEGTRWELLAAAEEKIYHDAPWIFLWFPTRYELVSPRLKGYRMPVIFNGQRYLKVAI